MCRFHVSNVLVQALRAGEICRSGPGIQQVLDMWNQPQRYVIRGVSHRDRGCIRQRAQNGREKDRDLARLWESGPSSSESLR